MSLRRISLSLCRVADETVTPPTTTGSNSTKGVTRPVRPVLTAMRFTSVFFSSGGNL
jgi:hypothetical protein